MDQFPDSDKKQPTIGKRTQPPVNNLKPMNIKDVAQAKGDEISADIGMLDARFAKECISENNGTKILSEGILLRTGSEFMFTVDQSLADEHSRIQKQENHDLENSSNLKKLANEIEIGNS